MVESGRFQEEVMSDFLKAKWGSGRWMRRGEWKQIAHYLNRELLMNTEICSRLLQLTDASSWFVKSENRTHSRVPLFPQGIHLARCTPSSSSLPSSSSVLFEWNIKSYMLISRVQHLRRQIVPILLLIASCISTLFWDNFIIKDLKLIPEFNFPWGTWKRVSNKKRSLSTTPRIIPAGSKL